MPEADRAAIGRRPSKGRRSPDSRVPASPGTWLPPAASRRSAMYFSYRSVLFPWPRRAEGTACPNGITTIIGAAFFSASRLSMMKFACPASVQPPAVSFDPWKRYSTGYAAWLLLVARRRVHPDPSRLAVDRRRFLPVDLHRPVRNIARFPERRRFGRNIHHARRRARPQLHIRIHRIRHRHAIHVERVNVDRRIERPDGHAPHALPSLRHFLARAGRHVVHRERHLGSPSARAGETSRAGPAGFPATPDYRPVARRRGKHQSRENRVLGLIVESPCLK